ncbi:MAG: helix-turn-helix domain-containing protein [Xenococcaceae cyanobacterium]
MLVDTIQAASLLGVSPTRVRMLLKQGRVVGAYKLGRFWVIPLTAGMPVVSKGTRGPQFSFKSARANACSIIRINRQQVDRNHKESKFDPVITVKKGNSNTYGHEVEINGPCRIVYSQDLTKLGARVWIETFSTVKVFCKNFLPIKEASYSS